MITEYIRRLALASLALSFSAPALAQIDQTVPSMNPTAVCKVNGAKQIEGIRDYGFLTSDDCRTIFVMPETFGRQHIRYSIESNLDLCEAVDISTKRVNMMERQVTTLHKEIAKLTLKKVNSEWARRKRDKDIAAKKKEIDWLQEQITEQLDLNDLRYGGIRGARFSILNDARVLDDDLVEIAKNNYYQVVVTLPGKPPEIYEKKPNVRKAAIVDSYYSFFVRKAHSREKFASVITTDSPVAVHSESRRYGVAHVQANDTLPAEMELNLPSICVGAKKNANDEWELTDNRKDPIFTVSRTYTVKQRIAFGYTSALKINKVVQLLENYIYQSGNRPFTVDDVFLQPAIDTIDSFLEFTWSQQMGVDGQSLSPLKEKELKMELLAGYLQNYLEELLRTGVLKAAGSGSVGDSTESSRKKCFQSPLTKKCYEETYQLANWDGKPGDAVKASLTLNQNYVKTVGVNQMEPFQYTSTFIPTFLKNN